MNIRGTYYTEFFIDELFKSEFFIEYEYILIESKSSEKCSICLTEGEQYLFYGSKSTSRINSFKVSQSFRTKKIEEAEADLTYLMKLPCEYGESTNRGCPRHLSPVCGCNGTTYDNACEASSDGITQWKDGKCR